MTKSVITLLTFVLSFQNYSLTTEYLYSCGSEESTIVWIEYRMENTIQIKTMQGREVHEYLLDSNYETLSWSYKNNTANINLTTVKNAGSYTIKGTLKGKPYSKSFSSNGLPWYQNIGFNVGYSMKGKQSYLFECIRPDNLKLYEMQADAAETAVNNGTEEQRIHVHLTGLLSKFFGSDYYIDPSTRQFIRYKGVHGAPGTPETIITLKK